MAKRTETRSVLGADAKGVSIDDLPENILGAIKVLAYITRNRCSISSDGYSWLCRHGLHSDCSARGTTIIEAVRGVALAVVRKHRSGP